MSAQILTFTGRLRGKPSLRRDAADDVASTIVILPCVRYERLGGSELHEAAGSPEPLVQFASAHH